MPPRNNLPEVTGAHAYEEREQGCRNRRGKASHILLTPPAIIA
jgi:hypothetical protein